MPSFVAFSVFPHHTLLQPHILLASPVNPPSSQADEALPVPAVAAVNVPAAIESHSLLPGPAGPGVTVAPVMTASSSDGNIIPILESLPIKQRTYNKKVLIYVFPIFFK